MRTCPACGTETRDEARFCSSCGNDLGYTSGEASASAAPLPPITPGPPPVVVPASPKQVLAPSGPPAPPSRSSNAAPLVAGAVAVLVVIVIVAVVLTSSGGDTTESSSTVAPSLSPDDQGESSATQAPPITNPPRPSTTATTEPPDPAALRLAQRLASALADGDWATARALQPDRAGYSDADFAGYEDLEASTVIPVGPVPIGTSTQTLNLGLVAHQNQGGTVQTTVYCVTWTVNPAAQTVRQEQRYDELVVLPGHVDPESQRSTIESNC